MIATTLPPGPKRTFPGVFLFRFRRDPLRFLMEMAHEYGDVVHFQLGPEQVYFLNHPDYVKDILITQDRNFMKGRALQRTKRLLGEGLLTSEGAFHHRQRRMIQPSFHRHQISSYASVMSQYAERVGNQWQDGEIRDISQEMARLTLMIVGKAIFGTDVENDAGDVGEALTLLVESFNLLTFPFGELLERLPLPQMRRVRKAIERLDSTIYRLIEERKHNNKNAGDMLSTLLASHDESEPMSYKQVRDEAMTIFLAGHETTANALTWTWYLLSQNPEAEAKLHNEIDHVLRGRLPTPEDLPHLPYTEKVLTESMRLYPPAWLIGRRALADYQAGEYTVPTNSIVAISQFVLHHDSRYFPDPWRFDPERWSDEMRAARPKYSYFPFGGGSRICLGEHFAIMEGLLLTATIAQKWKMQLVPDHPVALLPAITLRPKYGMRMSLHKR